MKRLFILCFCLFGLLLSKSFAQKQIFSAPNLKQIIAGHKVVAILPIKVTISYKRLPKNFNAADNAAQEKEEGQICSKGCIPTYYERPIITP